MGESDEPSVMDEFFLKAQAPEKLELEVIGDGVLDLTTVSAVELQVTRPGSPDLDEEIWTVDITAQSEDQLLMEHEFTITDIDRVGVYRVMIILDIPAGEERAGPVFFRGRYI